MSNLVKFYKNYYTNQTNRSFEYLINYIFHKYNFENYQEHIEKIFELYIKKEIKDKKNYNILSSNGSVSLNTNYEFSPNFNSTCSIVENFLRKRDLKTILIWAPNLSTKYEESFEIKKSKNYQYDISIKGDWRLDYNIEKLIKIINKFHENKKINLLAHPNIWILLTTNKNFKNFLETNKNKYCVVNTDWDCSYVKIDNVFYLDQMIDWKSGLNFYTCEHRTKHFLPFFFQNKENIYNLLNLKKIASPIDDLFIIGNKVEICECKKPYLKLDAIFHYKNKIINKNNKIINFDEFYNKLNENFLNLQFFQKKKKNNEVFVFYSIKNKSEKDMIYIENFFKENNIDKIKMIQNKYFQVGKKKYSNWKADSVEVYDFFEKPKGELSENNRNRKRFYFC